MERKDQSPTLFNHCSSSAFAQSQGQLFSTECLRNSGQPLRFIVRDPNHPSRTKCLVAASKSMQDLVSRIQQVACTNAIVLLLGESGTGKNLLAWLIHQLSPRREGPFVHFSAGQKSELLIESEMFGHERGAFTGAHEARRGKIEVAQRGTLFIDEVAELGVSGQLKFHRLLDDGTYERLGGTQENLADVRVVAATHRDLGAMAKEGKFREDLYYRINVVCLQVPPLRERPEDIPVIALELVEDLAMRHGKPQLHLGQDVLEYMATLSWHGNVRSLRNAIEQMVIFAKNEQVRLSEVSREVFQLAQPLDGTRSLRQSERNQEPQAHERQRFHEAYLICRGNKSALSRLLNTSRSQVDRLLHRYGRPQ